MTTRNIKYPVGFDGQEIEGYFRISKQDTAMVIVNRLTATQLRLWLYLMMIDPFADTTASKEKIYHPIPSPAEIASKIGASPEAVEKDIRKLKKLGLLPEGLLPKLRNHNPVEDRIRNRLRSEIGGLSEISTPVGRIDLLTDTEIIEVKRFGDWKAALGQILIYSAFYPEHQKRIHLFGCKTELEKLFDVESACLGFAVKVTGEEV
ncbi:MAG: hypothetical protein N5P05_004160 (plasmid) [Chroococcopsis gigantea SAG 12.99]|nr:hypothetical protein [Chroococcopsis gigantea SAG 12.99]